MNFVESQTVARMKHLADSLIPSSGSPGDADTSAGFLDLSPKDIANYSVLRGISNLYSAITRRASNLGAHRANQSNGNMGGHEELSRRLGNSPGFTGLEAECSAEIAKRLGVLQHGGQFYVPADVTYYKGHRDLGVASLAAGGALVGTKNVSFIDALRATSVLYRLGAQPLPGQKENIVLPKQTTAGTATWLTTEASTITETNQVFVQVPSTPKTVGGLTEISRQLLLQSNPAAEGVVMADLAAIVATAVDAAGINGSGSSGQPTGILQTSGVGTASGTTLAWAALNEVQQDLGDANAIVDAASLGYATTPAVAGLLASRQRFSGTDSPLWQGPLHAGVVAGLPALSTKNVPASTLIFGSWSSMVIPEYGTLVLEVDPFSKFTTAIVAVRALWSVDILIRQPLAFSAITSIS